MPWKGGSFVAVTIDLDSKVNVTIIKNGETISFEDYISNVVDERIKNRKKRKICKLLNGVKTKTNKKQ